MHFQCITLPTKLRLVKAMVFLVVSYGCESWTIKEAEHRRIDAFELWCWRRLLKVPWTARRSNQSTLKKILNIHWKDWCWNSNTLATWCEELTHWKRPWCLERLKAGGEGDDREWDGWMVSLTWWTWVSVNSGSWWWTERPGMLEFMRWQRVGHDWATDLIWSDLNSNVVWEFGFPGVTVVNNLPAKQEKQEKRVWSLHQLDPLEWDMASSVQISCSSVSHSLQDYELQHARLSCWSPTPRAYSNSCLLSQWCHSII